ncbi:hypothetical protein [Ponticaulis sp.]|uniref:hypothetical protein n=1 Tax=Ponticaulis sp. TaxID=2020902 RepID=UPI000C5810A9|nr:hypothetical protein [Ponticaulis sp.]MAJ10038.1 hypothetical protein [Ponticaulis sp.]HBH90440.1 hypothetical protein [Hyphomonadaceae bacterium]HBJ92158.1 hypothetical protein [Hyphomonadaceae bacterium]|tara:strand:- start:21361 stop:21573 length:213 start_codon:yes stop_codon:yes gene_type:complete
MAGKISPGAGMAIGIGCGTAMGAGLMAATDQPSMLAVGIGCGVAIGAALTASFQRKADAQADSSDDNDQT